MEEKNNTPYGNTGVTDNIAPTSAFASPSNGPDDFEEFKEIQRRRWQPEQIGSVCPVSGRVVRFDGLTFTAPINYLEECQRKLQEIFNSDHPFELNVGETRWYKSNCSWLYGVSIHYSHRVEKYNNHFMCDFLGQASNQLSLEDFAELYLFIKQIGGHPTLEHLDVDDYKHEVTP